LERYRDDIRKHPEVDPVIEPLAGRASFDLRQLARASHPIEPYLYHDLTPLGFFATPNFRTSKSPRAVTDHHFLVIPQYPRRMPQKKSQRRWNRYR